MRKFYLMTAVLAITALAANADTKYVYRPAQSLELWETSRNGGGTNADAAYWATTASTLVETSEGNYVQFGDGSSSFNGTRFSTVWGDIYGDYDVDSNGYTMEIQFNFAQWGNNSSSSSQRNNGITVINVEDASSGISSSYYGSGVDVYDNFLFNMSQVTDDDNGVISDVSGSCNFYINADETTMYTLTAATWYTLVLYINGSTVEWSIMDLDKISSLYSGSYTLPDGASNRVGGVLFYQGRYLGILQAMNQMVYFEKDGAVANEPIVTLSSVQGESRFYIIEFGEDEELHITYPDGTTDDIDYWDGNVDAGKHEIELTTSGTLSCYTTKSDDTSATVTVEVECGWIQLPAPSVAITSVEEGYGKTYTVTCSNSDVLLRPTIAMIYTITYEDGGTETGEDTSGSMELTLTGKGTLNVVSQSIPVAGNYYYQSNETTIENDVEYVIAETVDYQSWDDSHFADNANWTAETFSDSNSSHWIGHWATANQEGAVNPVKNPIDDIENNYDLPMYTLTADSTAYMTELLPICAYVPGSSVVRENVSVLLEEGIFVSATGYNYLSLSFDPDYATDDETKPNFIAVYLTSSYDRADKQETCHTMDIVETTNTEYTLYRYDTAINKAVVYTYKGFVPGSASGIHEVSSDNTVDAANAPIYTIGGVRVSSATKKGIYIQNGKKFIVK